MEEKIEKPTLAQLWQDIKKHRKLYYKVFVITFVVSAILLICTPNYYRCTVKLAPELSGSKSNSSLASIASSFGINIGSGSMGSEALFPTLYPDLMNSVAFRTSLFPIKVHREDDDTMLSYYDYLAEGQKKAWYDYLKLPVKWLKAALSSDDDETDNQLNPFKLTKDQYSIVEKVEKNIVCDVDKKTLVITIDVTDQDPLIAATMADSVQLHLQEFITDYRTRKARIDLAYNQNLYKEAKERYEQARKRYAAYADANRNALFESTRSERTKLENEMQLQYRTYSQVAAQLQLAEAKVQEETPAFTMLQPAFVPVKKAGPKRSILCLVFLFLAFIATTLYVWHKSDHLKSLLASFMGDSSSNDLDEDDLLKALIKISSPNTTTPQNQNSL